MRGKLGPCLDDKEDSFLEEFRKTERGEEDKTHIKNMTSITSSKYNGFNHVIRRSEDRTTRPNLRWMDSIEKDFLDF
ncbi:hypothetical protein TNCV_4219381 [Trichonephila clavipes]|nr:hypothetical protein TNCV_4219381 [Trichonephila clavipes]